MDKDRKLSVSELGRALGEMYRRAPERDAVAMIHLFGIRFAEELEADEVATKDVVEAAGMPSSYGTEVRKGIRLAQYATVNKSGEEQVREAYDKVIWS